MTDRPAQTMEKCSDLREDCQRRIHQKMDNQHREVMEELAYIREESAFVRGQAAADKGTSPSERKKYRDWWKSAAFQIALAWGPMLALLLLLGFLTYLRGNGWFEVLSASSVDQGAGTP